MFTQPNSVGVICPLADNYSTEKQEIPSLLLHSIVVHLCTSWDFPRFFSNLFQTSMKVLSKACMASLWVGKSRFSHLHGSHFSLTLSLQWSFSPLSPGYIWGGGGKPWQILFLTIGHCNGMSNRFSAFSAFHSKWNSKSLALFFADI